MHHTQAERSRRWRASPRGKFAEHKRNAKRRGVPFYFTFDEWLHEWTGSGRWDERGNASGQFVMCRRGDEGAYEPGNVYIGTVEQNLAEARSFQSVDWRKNGRRGSCAPAGCEFLEGPDNAAHGEYPSDY